MEPASAIDNSYSQHEGEEQFLTFKLDGLDYGIMIIKVQEIKGWANVTPLPNTPKYIKGVLNLRGTIIPVIDLRLRFSLEEAEYDSFTVIMVVNVGGGDWLVWWWMPSVMLLTLIRLSAAQHQNSMDRSIVNSSRAWHKSMENY